MGAVCSASVTCTVTCTTRGEGNGRSRPPARSRSGCRGERALPRLVSRPVLLVSRLILLILLVSRLILHVRPSPRTPPRTQRAVAVGANLTGRHLAAREIVAELRGRGRITPVGAKRARR